MKTNDLVVKKGQNKKLVLYHASSNRNLEILEPRVEHFRDRNEGPVVFASPDKSFVSCFLVRTTDKWALISKYTHPGYHPPIHIDCISDEERFRKLDKGGAIYTLPSEGFYLDKSKGRTEWTNKSSVIPISKEIYESGLDAMIENGVLVYFCDEEKLEELKKNAENFKKAMKILKGMKSENEKRGLGNIIYKYY